MMRSEDKDPAVDRWLDGLEPLRPPAELRSRVIAAARDRMASAEVSDWWSATWHNRGFRLAWTAAVVLLLAGHVVISSGGFSTSSTRPAARGGDPYLAAMIQPTKIAAQVRPMIGTITTTVQLELDNGGNSS
jgi:hypothetical protein